MEDYIILKDYEGDWSEIFLYDYELTNGQIERAEEIIQKVKDEIEDYTNEDIEYALNEEIPYINSIIIDNSNYHTIYF